MNTDSGNTYNAVWSFKNKCPNLTKFEVALYCGSRESRDSSGVEPDHALLVSTLMQCGHSRAFRDPGFRELADLQ